MRVTRFLSLAERRGGEREEEEEEGVCVWGKGGGGVGVTSGCLLLYPGGVNVFQSPV